MRKDRERIAKETGATLEVGNIYSTLRGVPDLTHLCYAAGLQLLSWSLGLAVTLVLLDSRSGLVRDHPPLGWRVAGMLLGPLAALSFAAVLLGDAPRWVSLGLALPYTLMALAASWVWYRGAAAGLRRQREREAAVLGVLAVLFASLAQTGGDGPPVLSLAASLGSAALVGGLGILALCGALGGRRDEVEVDPNCDGIPIRVAATGLGITLLAASDVGRALLTGEVALPTLLGLWLGCSLLVPVLLLAAGRRLAAWNRPLLWCAAWLAVVVGQLALQTSLVA